MSKIDAFDLTWGCKMDFDLFVIGGGSGGVRCGRIAAGHGARVAVAEERFWGGTCVNVGCVPKKMLVQAAEYGAWARDAAGFGWTMSVGGHDWAGLLSKVNAEVQRIGAVYRTMLEGAKAQAFDGRAVLVGPHRVRIGTREVTAEHVVIATGGLPVRPDFPGNERVLISDDLFSLPALPARTVILGGGYIACEFAGILAGLGSKVVQLYRGPLFLRGFDLDVRAGLAAEMRSGGIDLRFDTGVVKVEKAGSCLLVHATDGTVIQADAVFAAIGRRPNTEGLGLGEAGIRVTDQGAIAVDGMNETSAPRHYALGDVTDQVNLTPVATGQGHALADSLFGGRARTLSLENVPSAVFTAPPIATVGLTEEQAARRGAVDVYLSRFRPLRHVLSGRERRTLLKLIVARDSQKVVGLHVLGDDAAEMVQGFAVAVVAGLTKQQFDATVGIHPTAAEELVTMRQKRPDPVVMPKAAE